MHFRIYPAVESIIGLGIYLITVELETGNRESDSCRDISPYSDNLSFGVVRIRHKSRGGFSYDRNASYGPRRRNLDPFIGLENHSIFRHEASGRTENLFLAKLIVYVHSPVSILCTHLVDRGDIERVLHGYFQAHGAYIDSILVVQYARFFLGKYNIPGYSLDAEFRSDRYIGLGYREVEYEGEKREGDDETDDKEKYMGIPSRLFILVDLGFLLGKEDYLGKKLVDLVSGIFEKGEVMAENVFFRVLLLELYVVVFLVESDSERFSEFLEFSVVGYERKPFHREAVEQELEVQVIGQMDIVLDLQLNLGEFRLGYFFEYLDQRVVSVDDDRFFIHIGRLCSGGYGLWGLFSKGAFLLWL